MAPGVVDWPAMALYHVHAQVVSRGSGASAVAGAAYRSRDTLTDERTGEAHDYRSRRDDLDGAEILTPQGSPAWAQDRARLWNAVEAAERRKDAQVAREVRVAIPRELSAEDRRALVRDYAQRSFVDRGMVADIAFHGGQGENTHAHIMLTTRTLTPEGFGPKNREWNKKEHLVTWRKDWADRANSALARAGRAERIDHRTLVEQRDEALANGDPERAVSLDRDPQIHLGRAAHIAAETKQPTELTTNANAIEDGNLERERERTALYDELRAIEQQIAQLVEHIRRAAGKAVEKVKELVRGPQPEPAAPSAEPPKAERPTGRPGGDRGADDTWMPGDGFLGRGH